MHLVTSLLLVSMTISLGLGAVLKPEPRGVDLELVSDRPAGSLSTNETAESVEKRAIGGVRPFLLNLHSSLLCGKYQGQSCQC